MVRITKSGIRCFEWDSKQRKDVEKLDILLIDYLRDCVTQVDENVTLGDIITFVAKDEFLPLFVGTYSGCNVVELYQELEKGGKLAAGKDEIHYCTAAMKVGIYPVLRKKSKNELKITYDFHGCGDNGNEYTLDLSPLVEIAALPFRLEDNASFQHLTEDGYKTETGLVYMPTLLEVLDAIFFDLTFFGSSTEKEAVSEEIKGRVQAINDGTATAVPLDLEKYDLDEEK